MATLVPTAQHLWPRRLLHIPSMTSLERNEGNSYGGQKEPRFAIISYTWGRFEIPNGPRIQINNVPWPVPAIREDHYTVQSLQNVLQQIMRGGREYVWIDIACIDQQDFKVKAEEIGRQGGIFNAARVAYVWLNKYEPVELQRCFQTILQNAYEVLLCQMSPIQAARNLQPALNLLFDDPWFTSLWTLQESFLKRDAFILDKNGEFVHTKGPWTAEDGTTLTSMLSISVACHHIKAFLPLIVPNASQPETEGVRKCASDIQLMIDRSGIAYSTCPNPNIQFAAARFRQTRDPRDRIYGIMQAYGYRLGTATNSSKDFTLEQLQLQFLQHLASTSSLLCQAFVHVHPPPKGRSWSIFGSIQVPPLLQRVILHSTLLSEGPMLTVHSKDKAYFDGVVWDFEYMLQFLRKWSDKAIEAAVEDSIKDRQEFLELQEQAIYLDASKDYDASTLACSWPSYEPRLDHTGRQVMKVEESDLRSSQMRFQENGTLLIKMFRIERIGVLYIGRSKYMGEMNTALIIVREDYPLICGQFMKWSRWKRIGLCCWSGSHSREELLKERPMLLKGRFC